MSETKIALMKKLEVFIKPGKLDAVKKALTTTGYTGVTVSQVEGHGNQKGLSTGQNGDGFRLDLLPKTRVEIVVAEGDLEKIVQAISTAAKTGQAGDGKIFISDVQDIIRIRTGERGMKAL